MNKPKEILALERIYGITLEESVPDEYQHNCYTVNAEGIVTQLYLSGNRLTEIKRLENLVGLQQLYLSYNQLTEIKGLENLIGLQELHLDYNQLTEIKGLENLVGLQQVLYQLAKIKRPEKPVGRLHYLRIGNNPFLKKPDLLLKEYKNQRDIILKYFSDLKQKKVKVTLPAKVMLLGNHASGKTTFRHYMLNGKLIKPESTPILEIVPYPKQWTERMRLPEAIIFDFGGQDYYHGLYQAFFSEDPIYMLFWCNKSNWNDIQQAKDGTNSATRNFTIEYWQNQLKYVDAKRKKEREKQTRKNSHLSIRYC
jgi:internalin A